MKDIEYLLPNDIEKRSFEIISEELSEMGVTLPEKEAPIIKRAIHTSADFSYADTLCFSENAVELAVELITGGACVVTDTNMALAGINKGLLSSFGGEAYCFMAEKETARLASERKTTRAAISVERASMLNGPVIYAVGNAPTALIKLYDMITNGLWRPAFIIGVPVGFVNVEQAKEMIMETDVPHIVNRGRKGGSGIAAAIVNALLIESDKAGNGR